MSTYVPDISSLRWVIISPKRIARPDEFSEKEKKCPFCPGNEAMTGTEKEVLRYGEGEPGKPGWTLRVITNKFPITDFHEVVIHSPDDSKDIEDFEVPQIELIFKAYRERFNFHKKSGSVLIFCNHGEHAGASVKHPHSQIVVIPKQITIDALVREPLNNVVDETTYFTMYCPEFSQWPYEVWIAPKKDKTYFGEITDEEIADISVLLQRMIRRLEVIYKGGIFSSLPFGYNFYIYPKENWYLRIIPRFIHKAGFELGTGLNVNIVDPKTAAVDLRADTMVSVLEKLKKFKE
jgi:UDPglucose--hexose-1-phosphate uridylyltransferase